MKLKPKEAVGRLAINILAIVLIAFTYSSDFERNLNFSMNYKEREKVVKMVKSGELWGVDTIKLPEKYKGLSKGGEIEMRIEGNILYIKFLTYCLFPGEFEGIIYCDNDKPPRKTLFFIQDSNLEYFKKASKWYWFSHD